LARRVTWSDSAWEELECAASFIRRDSRRYAAALIEEARDAARSLRKFPARGRIVPEIDDDRVRELFVKRYRLIYEIQDKGIVILAFIHGARQFPSDVK
jgi:toxin ParE1/3/4